MTQPTNFPDQDELLQTRSELREQLQSSRDVVRQSQLLIALSESPAPVRAAGQQRR